MTAIDQPPNQTESSDPGQDSGSDQGALFDILVESPTATPGGEDVLLLEQASDTPTVPTAHNQAPRVDSVDRTKEVLGVDTVSIPVVPEEVPASGDTAVTEHPLPVVTREEKGFRRPKKWQTFTALGVVAASAAAIWVGIGSQGGNDKVEATGSTPVATSTANTPSRSAGSSAVTTSEAAPSGEAYSGLFPEAVPYQHAIDNPAGAVAEWFKLQDMLSNGNSQTPLDKGSDLDSWQYKALDLVLSASSRAQYDVGGVTPPTFFNYVEGDIKEGTRAIHDQHTGFWSSHYNTQVTVIGTPVVSGDSITVNVHVKKTAVLGSHDTDVVPSGQAAQPQVILDASGPLRFVSQADDSGTNRMVLDSFGLNFTTSSEFPGAVTSTPNTPPSTSASVAPTTHSAETAPTQTQTDLVAEAIVPTLADFLVNSSVSVEADPDDPDSVVFHYTSPPLKSEFGTDTQWNSGMETILDISGNMKADGSSVGGLYITLVGDATGGHKFNFYSLSIGGIPSVTTVKFEVQPAGQTRVVDETWTSDPQLQGPGVNQIADQHDATLVLDQLEGILSQAFTDHSASYCASLMH